MDSLIKTLKRIQNVCRKHEGDCGSCVYKEKRHIANQEEKYVCVITESFENCFGIEDGIKMPSEWDIEELEDVIGERSI